MGRRAIAGPLEPPATVEFVGVEPPAPQEGRRAVGTAAAVALLVGALAVAGPWGAPAGPERHGRRMSTGPSGIGRLAIPEPLAGRSDRLTFVGPAGRWYGTPLRRLWRLDLTTGTVVPGAIVAPVRATGLGPGSHRLFHLMDGGGLVSIDRLAAGSLDGYGDRRAISAHVAQRPTGFDAEVEVRFRVRPPGLDVSGPTVITRRIAGIDLGGIAVHEPVVYVWGARPRSHLLVAVSRARFRRWRLGSARVVDVAPDGRVLLSDRRRPSGDLPLLAGALGSRPKPLGLGIDVATVVAWAPDGASAAVIGSNGGRRRGLWLLPLGGGRLRRLTAPPGSLSSRASFSKDSRLLWWAAGNAVMALDVGNGRQHRIGLPPGLRAVGPVAPA